MGHFLREYSASESAPPKPWGKYALGVLGVLLVAGVAWWFLRDRSEVGEVTSFIDDLKTKNYEAAYQRWGCSKATPCRDYTMERFLEDWGPNSPAAKPDAIKLTEKRSCSATVIQNLDLGGGETVTLIIDREKRTLGFSPWKVCRPRTRVE